jgi:hypothetical protein
VRQEFDRGATLPVLSFPESGAAVGDSPRLTLVVLDPAQIGTIPWSRIWPSGRSGEVRRTGSVLAHWYGA